MNGFNFQQLKKFGKSNFFASNLLNQIRLFLENAIDRMEVAGSSPVGIIEKPLESQGGFVFIHAHKREKKRYLGTNLGRS